jgi:hypothetical protein
MSGQYVSHTLLSEMQEALSMRGESEARLNMCRADLRRHATWTSEVQESVFQKV